MYSWSFEHLLLMFFFSLLDNEKVVELLQAIKEKSITLDTIRHAPHPLCKSPPAHASGETCVFPDINAHLCAVPGCILSSLNLSMLTFSHVTLMLQILHSPCFPLNQKSTTVSDHRAPPHIAHRPPMAIQNPSGTH